MRNFKKLKIWQKGFDIAINSFEFIATFPKEERFGIFRQITKAAVSIPSNIAEGNSRSSDKDKNRFIEIAIGSAFEMETQLLIAQAVNYGDMVLREKLLNELDLEQKMLISFSSTLLK